MTIDQTAPVAKPGRPRRSPGWVPNQHGAWAMLASPLLVGILAGGFAWIHLALAAFWFVGYFAFYATSLWLKARRKPRYLPPVRAYGLASVVLGLIVLALDPSLLRWTPLFVVPLGAGLWFAAQRQERALSAGLLTLVASGLMTVVAYDAGPGTDLHRAWLLALVQFLYFAGTVFYVKTVIRERANPAYWWLSVGVHVAATVAMAWLSWWLVAAFALLTVRAAIVPRLGATPKQVGIGEIAATVVVAAISLLVV